jgi:hypothetical protein
MVQRCRPRPVGSKDRTTRYKHFNAACSDGKCPRALTARRKRAFKDSIAFVEKITRRTSTSNARNGTNSAYALSHNRMIPGYLVPHTLENSPNRSRAAASVGAV